MGDQILAECSTEGRERVRVILNIPYIVSPDAPRYGEDLTPFTAYDQDVKPVDLVNSLFFQGIAGNEIDPKKAANGC
jgi:hypothetical protein